MDIWHWFPQNITNMVFRVVSQVGCSPALCRSCKVIIRWFSTETQCDLSTVMKVSGNLGHMSGDHLHTPGLSMALSWRLRGAYSPHRPRVFLSISSCWHFKAPGFKVQLMQKCTSRCTLNLSSALNIFFIVSDIGNLREIDDNTSSQPQ